MVLWNNIDKRIEVLQGGKALRLFSELHSQDNWKSQDISVTRLVHKIEIQSPPRGRRKKMEQEPKVEPGKSEDVYEEMVHLPPEAGPELLGLLEEKRPILSEMAAKEKKQWEEAVGKIWDWMFESFHEKEQKELDFTTRPFAWQRHDPYQWVCHYQSAEGCVCIGKANYCGTPV